MRNSHAGFKSLPPQNNQRQKGGALCCPKLKGHKTTPKLKKCNRHIAEKPGRLVQAAKPKRRSYMKYFRVIKFDPKNPNPVQIEAEYHTYKQAAKEVTKLLRTNVSPDHEYFVQGFIKGEWYILA